MRRGPWLAVIAAGSVLTGVSTTGVIAPASDVARTGAVVKENFETDVFAPSVDLKLGRDDCAGAFTDDLDSPLYQFHLSPGDRDFLLYRYICVKNFGDDPAMVRLRVADIQGSDLTCEPDEGSACGKNGDIVLSLRVHRAGGADPACPSFVVTEGGAINTASFSADGPAAVWESDGAIEPGMACNYEFGLMSPGVFPGQFPYEAQTDRLEWRYRFSTI
jgi:hypothetical protein